MDSYLLIYIIAVVMSAVLMSIIAITGIGVATLGYRIFNGVGAVVLAVFAYYLASRFQGDALGLYFTLLLAPFYAAYKLWTGFQERGVAKRERDAR